MSNSLVLKVIPINSILPSRHQARKDLDQEYVKSLAESIKKNGLKVPIKVREVEPPNPLPEGVVPFDGKCYELIYGANRKEACVLAEHTDMPAIVGGVESEADAAVDGYLENTMRKPLAPFDEADFFKYLKGLNPEWKWEKVAESVGKSPAYVSQSLGFLELSGPVKENFSQLKLPRNHILELMRLPDDNLKMKAAQEIAAKDLSQQSTRQLVDKMLGSAGKADKAGKGKAAGKGGGVHIAKAGKNIHIDVLVPADTPIDAITKAITDEHQKWQAEQANINKTNPQTRPGGPDAKAKKAAIAAKKLTADALKAERDAAKLAKKAADLKAKAEALTNKTTETVTGGKTASTPSTLPPSPLASAASKQSSSPEQHGLQRLALKWRGGKWRRRS